MAPIFRDYDAIGLERQYMPRHWPGVDVPAITERWIERSSALHGRVDVVAGLAYGDSDRQRIDLLRRGDLDRAPILAFLHGGYWRSRPLDRFSYSFCTEPLVAAGALVAMLEYDLCPDVTMDVLVGQVREACSWLWRHAAQYGGDPLRIHVAGHSAGGHLAAMMAATDWPAFAADLPAGMVRSIVPISGLFDLEPLRLSYLNESLRLDPASVRRNSPVLLSPPVPLPVSLIVGGAESDEYHRHSRDLAERWVGATTALTCRHSPGHHHFSVIETMPDPGSLVTETILRHLAL